MVAFIFIIFGTIVFLFFFFSKKAVIKRKLRKAPFKDVKDFMNGDVAKVVGLVDFVDKPLIAPLSGRECAHFHVKIQKKVQNGKSSSWRTIIEEEITSRFVVRDGRDCAYINKARLKSYIVKDAKFKSGFLNDANERLEAYLNKHGHKSEGFFGFNKTMRYEEGILEKDERIAVLGQGEWKMASDLDLPDSYGKLLVLTAMDGQYLYLSDDVSTTAKNVQPKVETVEPVVDPIVVSKPKEKEKKKEKEDEPEVYSTRRKSRYNKKEKKYRKE